VFVPHTKSPEEEVTTTPSGKVSVDTLGVCAGCGPKVKVSPSVVTVIGVLCPMGTVTVFVPQTKSPEAEVTTTPSGKVWVDAPGVCAGCDPKVKVSPSVVTVTGVLCPMGTVTVFVPQTSTPAWDVTIWPSGRVVVSAGEGTPVVGVPVPVPEAVVVIARQDPSG
jgi:phage shock protein PspC (stress-responsive transcriptional regulator)